MSQEYTYPAVATALPVGAATAANQTNGNQKTQIVDGSGNVIASTSNALNVNISSGALTDAAEGTPGSAAPAKAIQVGGSDGTNLRTVKVSAAGLVSVDGSAVTQPVSGTVAATQSGAWNITNVTGTVSLPTGASTAAKQPALGVAGTASTDVITVQGIASMTALKVDGTGGSFPVSGTVAATQSGTWDIRNVSGTVSLPTGAATAANQATEITSLASIDTKTPALGQAVAANSVPVVLTSAQLTTLTPLTSVTVTQGTGTNLHTVVDSGTVAATQSGAWTVQPGNTANTRAWLTTQVGRTTANAPVRNAYGSVNVTTSAYVQLVASTTAATSEIEIFDSSGQTLFLSTGGAGSEVDQIIIYPGGNGRIPLKIAASTRVSIKAISATANSGEIDINFYA